VFSDLEDYKQESQHEAEDHTAKEEAISPPCSADVHVVDSAGSVKTDRHHLEPNQQEEREKKQKGQERKR